MGSTLWIAGAARDECRPYGPIGAFIAQKAAIFHDLSTQARPGAGRAPVPKGNTMLIKHVVLLSSVLACSAALAQIAPKPAPAVAPPARSDMALRGSLLATRNVADHLACQSECQRTPGCTGYSFDRAAKATCALLGGTLADVAVRGAVSCRMPCEPGPRATALAQRLPATGLLRPAPTTASASAPAPVPDRPVSLLQRAPGLPLQKLPSTPAAGTGTASTQAASFGTGIPPPTNLPPCVPGRVSQVGMCGSGAVPATPPPADVTVTLIPVNDNTIGSSGLSATYEQSVYQSNYWFSTPGIGMGCNQLLVVLSGAQYVNCARGLIKFNLASLAGKTIQSATLRLTTSASGTGNYKDPWYLAASASPWNGATVTWLSYGEQTYPQSYSIQNAPTSAGQIFALDQTATVRNWVSGTYANNGFAMALQQEQLRYCRCNSIDLFEFYSSEDSGGRGPKLIVTYH